MAKWDVDAALRELIADWEGARPMKMFGYNVFGANGKMFGWTGENELVLTTLTEAAREEVTQEYQATPYEITGHGVFKSWLRMSVPNRATFEKLIPMIRMAYEQAVERSMQPPKEPRRKRPPKRM